MEMYRGLRAPRGRCNPKTYGVRLQPTLRQDIPGQNRKMSPKLNNESYIPNIHSILVRRTRGLYELFTETPSTDRRQGRNVDGTDPPHRHGITCAFSLGCAPPHKIKVYKYTTQHNFSGDVLKIKHTRPARRLPLRSRRGSR